MHEVALFTLDGTIAHARCPLGAGRMPGPTPSGCVIPAFFCFRQDIGIPTFLREPEPVLLPVRCRINFILVPHWPQSEAACALPGVDNPPDVDTSFETAVAKYISYFPTASSLLNGNFSFFFFFF